LVSLSVVLNCSNVDSVCSHLSSDAGHSQARSAQRLRRIGTASRKPDGQSCADGTRRNCSAQRANAHYQHLHCEASKLPAMRRKPISCFKNRALSPPLPATGVIFDLFWRRDVLGLAVTKGPIFLRDFNKADEDIFLANLYSFVEMVRQCFVEALLQLSGTAAIQCDLKKDAIVRPMYSEILSIEWQARLRVFRDYLKSVMFRNIENIHQGLVKNIADLSTVLF
jgi:hypothetical protein